MGREKNASERLKMRFTKKGKRKPPHGAASCLFVIVYRGGGVVFISLCGHI